MRIRFPKRIRLARTPTPIEPMRRLSDFLGGPEIWFKRDDLTGLALSGNKVRKLEFSLAQALRQKADVIITAGGMQSNHCRATAFACAQLGLACHLVLRGPSAPGEAAASPGATKQRSRHVDGASDGNLLLDRLAGARISIHPRDIYSSRKPEIVAELAEDYARQGKHAYYIPVGASNAIGTWGYVRAFEELVSQADRMGVHFDHIVTAVGSGGTLSGLIAGRTLLARREPEVWGVNVCDDEGTFIRECRAILDEMNERFGLKLRPSATPIRILDGYVGEGYAIPYREELDLIAWCATNEGQVLDPVYTGKALYGLGQEIRKGLFPKREKVLFVHTGGVFGLFPERASFGL